MPQRYISTEEIVTRFIKTHGNKYNYNKVVYVNWRNKVTIGCPKHGDFEQTVSNHMGGYGCAKCKIDYLASLRKLTTEKFIEKARQVHGDRYEYDKIEYIYNTKPVTITCKVHGDFEQIPNLHLQGRKCRKCKYDLMADLLRLPKNEFIERANEVHMGKYSYEQMNYVSMLDRISITCPIHGVFRQAPVRHLAGSGCYSCNSSRGEANIETILNKNNIRFIREYIIPDVRPSYRYDFYLPDLNILIEYHGIQHFKYVPFFHKNDENEFKRKQLNDVIKKDIAKTMNFGFLEFDYVQLTHMSSEDFELLVSEKILRLCDIDR